MSTHNLSIVIVTFNSEKHIKRCLECIEKDSSVPIKKIIVIDNNSTDSTVKIVKDIKKNISLIQNSKNLGFAKGVNQGIKYSKSNYYLLLNPDAFIQKNSLLNLINCSEINNCICGGKTTDMAGNEQGDHFRLPNLLVGIFDFTNMRKLLISDYWHKYFYYKDQKRIVDCFEVGSVCGGFMMIPKSIIEKIGYFDESFFMYLEDLDFCLRAHKAKSKVIYCQKARAIHIGGASSNNSERSNLKAWYASRKRYFIKHFNFIDNLIIQPIFIIDELLISLKKRLYENFNN